MRLPPFIHRLIAAVACVLQIASVAAIWGDARLEAASARGPGAHVEEQGSRTCPPAHQAECALCHHITSTQAPPRDTIAVVEHRTLHRLPATAGWATRPANGELSSLPRAPPFA